MVIVRKEVVAINSYKEAENVDNVIQDLLKQYPINIFYKDWARFSRTLSSTLDIINARALSLWINEDKGGDVNAEES